MVWCMTKTRAVGRLAKESPHFLKTQGNLGLSTEKNAGHNKPGPLEADLDDTEEVKGGEGEKAGGVAVD